MNLPAPTSAQTFGSNFRLSSSALGPATASGKEDWLDMPANSQGLPVAIGGRLNPGADIYLVRPDDKGVKGTVLEVGQEFEALDSDGETHRWCKVRYRVDFSAAGLPSNLDQEIQATAPTLLDGDRLEAVQFCFDSHSVP